MYEAGTQSWTKVKSNTLMIADETRFLKVQRRDHMRGEN
jgi:hypothetical protein